LLQKPFEQIKFSLVVLLTVHRCLQWAAPDRSLLFEFPRTLLLGILVNRSNGSPNCVSSLLALSYKLVYKVAGKLENQLEAE